MHNTDLNLSGLLKMNKSDISETISEKIELIDDGYLDVVDFFIYLKKLEYVVKTSLDAVKDRIDYSKFENTQSKYYCELVAKQVGVKYDFSNCGHYHYNQYAKTINETKEEMKQIETFLKSLKSKTSIVDEESGEVFELNPPIKTGSTTVQLTFKNE